MSDGSKTPMQRFGDCTRQLHGYCNPDLWYSLNPRIDKNPFLVYIRRHYAFAAMPMPAERYLTEHGKRLSAGTKRQIEKSDVKAYDFCAQKTAYHPGVMPGLYTVRGSYCIIYNPCNYYMYRK